MDTIQKNDSIILKGTNFKTKPVFGCFNNSELDTLISNLMMKYGKSVTNDQPIKGKDVFYCGEQCTPKFRPVPIRLQPYFRPFYYDVLLVVGSDERDTLVLTSPIAENVRRLLGFSRWSRRPENHECMLKQIENKVKIIPLTYDCTFYKLGKDWHKTVHLRKRDAVELYVVPKPTDYFPMLFVNCSNDNIRNIYDNVTNLMLARNNPVHYSPFIFTCCIFRPIIFNIIDDKIDYKQRLPNIDVTDEVFVIRREEWLVHDRRHLISDCRCRYNNAVVPKDQGCSSWRWDKLERLANIYECSQMKLQDPPYYTPIHQNCKHHSNYKK
ncbi:hypothetical protein, no similarity [Maudiozyma saulgeensis]|uniref:Uncharacterized protein n=1 Tax=Maudiozyma saulgeensis TaxID=1789683 RepID=A0A1X7R205_9SACH|nr:hypothetical protein, no similarity [Kazachstania saulgeensis]